MSRQKIRWRPGKSARSVLPTTPIDPPYAMGKFGLLTMTLIILTVGSALAAFAHWPVDRAEVEPAEEWWQEGGERPPAA